MSLIGQMVFRDLSFKVAKQDVLLCETGSRVFRVRMLIWGQFLQGHINYCSLILISYSEMTDTYKPSYVLGLVGLDQAQIFDYTLVMLTRGMPKARMVSPGHGDPTHLAVIFRCP